MYTYTEINEELQSNVGQKASEADPKMKSAEFISRCFAARNAMHIFHLKTPLYSAHKAAQGFYEGIIPLIDSFAESVMGRMGKFDQFPNVKESSDDGLQIIGNLTKWVDANRMNLPQFSEIQNITDEIVSLCNSTAYLLRELR